MTRTEFTLEARQRLANDHHRPIYHYQPPYNWMNDPNGLIHWKGEYHLFYQHNPDSPLHANMHWGHAVSRDLVHWQDLPIALAPTPNSPDKDGVWSGCAVDGDGVPVIFYTGVFPESQLAVRCSDDMRSFEKYAGNPVIAGPPAGLDVFGFRDPFVWKEADGWYMLVGSGIKGVGGTVFLYRSPDLLHWDYLHPLLTGDKNDTGIMWECPGFFPLGGDQWALYVSITPLAYVEYFVGTYRDHRFTPDFHRRLDHSGLFYAPQSFVDAQGRRLMFAWVRESRAERHLSSAGWSSMQSIPRVLTPGSGGLIQIDPAPELQTLRRDHQHVESLRVSSMGDNLDGMAGRNIEIVAEFIPESAEAFGLKLLTAPDGSEETRLVYDVTAQTLTLDRSRSRWNPGDVDMTPLSGKVPLSPGEPLRLRVFVDGSVIEVIANGTESLTGRVYPMRAESVGVDAFARGGSALIRRLALWQMASVW